MRCFVVLGYGEPAALLNRINTRNDHSRRHTSKVIINKHKMNKYMRASKSTSDANPIGQYVTVQSTRRPFKNGNFD